MAIQIQLRRGTAAQWTSANPTLASGELGLETDSGKFKVGDGATAWTTLAYATGTGYGGVTATDSNTIGTGTKTFTITAGSAYSTGSRVRAAYTTTPSNYVEGIVTMSGTTMTMTADAFGGSGTYTAWTFSLAGNVGATGATGASFTGVTSTTSATPASTGTITLTTNQQGAFVTGNRVRAINTTSNYFEGVVTITGGTTFAIAADYNVGTTTATSWTISLAGAVGTAGASGMPTGGLIAYPSATTPTGYLKADGTAYATATYPTLQSVLGYIVDGIDNWTTTGTAATYTWNGVVYASGATNLYAAVGATGANGAYSYSTDGITWTSGTVTTTSSFTAITYTTATTNSYVAVGQGGLAGYSTNGSSWTTTTIAGGGTTYNAVSYFPAVTAYYAVGASGARATSANGTSWTTTATITASSYRAVVYASGNTNPYVLGGDGGMINYSTNASAWTTTSLGTTSSVRALGYGNNLFVAVGNGGLIATSTNAVTWTIQNSPTASSLLTVTYANSQWTAAGAGPVMLSSTDGINWFPNYVTPLATTSSINGLVYGTRYVFVNSGGYQAYASVYSYSTATSFVVPKAYNYGVVPYLTYGPQYVYIKT